MSLEKEAKEYALLVHGDGKEWAWDRAYTQGAFKDGYTRGVRACMDEILKHGPLKEWDAAGVALTLKRLLAPTKRRASR